MSVSFRYPFGQYGFKLVIDVVLIPISCSFQLFFRGLISSKHPIVNQTDFLLRSRIFTFSVQSADQPRLHMHSAAAQVNPPQ